MPLIRPHAARAVLAVLLAIAVPFAIPGRAESRTVAAENEGNAGAGQGQAILGGYDAVRYNGRALPAQDRFVGKQGYAHVARLEEMYIIVSAGGKFQAGARYALDYRRASDRSALPRPADETTRGSWTRQGNTVTFKPDTPKGRRPVQPVTGVVSGSSMLVTYRVETVGGPRTLRLEFRRNPNVLY
jgi:hypothetical protein